MSTTIKRTHILPIALAMLVAVFTSAPTRGAEKKPIATTVTVGEMCGGCVKRITARFGEEKDVSKVQCDIAKKSVTLVPEKDTRLSPRELWEILESIGKKPKKLVGPDGTFTSKPKKS